MLPALQLAWEVSEQACGKRLKPFLPELVEALERHGELTLSGEVRAQLLALSASTIDRRLAPDRRVGLRRPYRPSPAAGTLKAQVPIRTFGEWQDVRPGSVQADLVLHCGESTQGFYLTTLTVVDVATGWTERQGVWGKGQQRVIGALHRVRLRLPLALREFHTDNGSEFLNDLLQPYCQREGIRTSRGRAYKKNDQAYVEQKNWTAVRRLVGYRRYSSKAARERLNAFYELDRLYRNFFQPIRKGIGKERIGGRVIKRYDQAATPYQRLVASGVLDAARCRQLEVLYRSLNPVKLRLWLAEAVDALVAERERPQRTRSA